ncbi:Alpha/beta hydrolase fold-1 [Lentinula edodes]|nr:Alpha/beta hydrolase fold-1 [Lentinula edodes]
MSILQTEKVVVNTPPVDGLPSLKMVVNRYTRTPLAKIDPSCNNISIILFHGLGQTKEQWEPVLANLWDEAEGNADFARCYHISEAWTPEWPSHGESATLNKPVLLENNIQGISVTVWASGISAFFMQGYLKNKQVIAVGFSIGTLAMFNGLCPIFSAEKSTPVIGLVVVEPLMFDRETSSPDHPRSNMIVKMMKKGIMSQAENWPNQEAARQYLTKQLPWSQWEQSVFESYMCHGLENYEVNGKQGVKLICSRAEEASTYGQYQESWDALSMLEQLSSIIPIHVVFGSKDKLIPREWKACVIDTSKGRKVAGVHQIEASHMVPAEKPADFAKLVSQLIRDIICSPVSKL